jgi:hypothetical protein
VRRQPARIVDGGFGGRYIDVFELICPSCGDHPYLDYTEVLPRLQWLRGPRALWPALAAYHKHIGAVSPPGWGQSRKLGSCQREGTARCPCGGRGSQRPAADVSWIIRWEAS